MIWERELDIYGRAKMLKGEEGFCHYLYQGQTLDSETGLAYNRFRYYSPEEGIYISQDPIGLDGGAASYGYVVDSNLYVDIWGLSTTCPLDWSTINKKGETRIEHVRKHGKNNLQKENHGIFYGDPVAVTKDAWAKKSGIVPINDGGVDIYHIPRENAGYKGGYGGQSQNLNHVTIITKAGTNKIITAYPSFGH